MIHVFFKDDSLVIDPGQLEFIHHIFERSIDLEIITYCVEGLKVTETVIMHIIAAQAKLAGKRPNYTYLWR